VPGAEGLRRCGRFAAPLVQDPVSDRRRGRRGAEGDGDPRRSSDRVRRGRDRVARLRPLESVHSSDQLLLGETLSRPLGLDVLVINAGIGTLEDIEHETLEGWERTTAIN